MSRDLEASAETNSVRKASLRPAHQWVTHTFRRVHILGELSMEAEAHG